MLSPILDSIEARNQGKTKVFKVNVDEQPELAGIFGARAIPTVIVFEKYIQSILVTPILL